MKQSQNTLETILRASYFSARRPCKDQLWVDVLRLLIFSQPLALLIDGIDELSANDQAQFIKYLQQLATKLENEPVIIDNLTISQVIMTSRPLAVPTIQPSLVLDVGALFVIAPYAP